MKKKGRQKRLPTKIRAAGFLTSAALLGTAIPSGNTLAAPAGGNGWASEGGNDYWYESGIKQGTEGRGKEIYDPASDAWYWLDAVDGGKKAVSKDVYQESYAGPYADRADGTGKWSRYDADGRMVKGWNRNENGVYYFDPQYGAMLKGSQYIDGVSYSFNETTGVMESCGVSLEPHWETIDGVQYWYEDGIRQGYDVNNPAYRGKEIYDPGSDAWYWLDNVQHGAKAVNKDVYQESAAGIWADRVDGTGKWVRYNSQGHMVKGWDYTKAGAYYFDPKYGTMAKGTAVIDGQTWNFDQNTGICQDSGEHTHSYGQGRITQNSTCTQKGTITYTCTICGESRSEELPLAEHNYSDKVVAPTCTSRGYTEHLCSVCGHTVTDSYTNMTAHTYKDTVIPPTCTEKGYTEHKCGVCGHTEKDTYVDPSGHSYADTVIPPTCTEKGYTEHKCSVCGDTVKDTYVNPSGHSYVSTVIPPTCTEKGYTEHKCSVCGDTVKDTYVDASGHSYVNIIISPTCTEKGYTQHRCSVCGHTEKDTYVDASGHSYVDTVVPPTCTEKGYTEHKCSVCGDTVKDTYVDASGHSYVDTVIPPTCIEKGYTEHKCSVCGDTYNDTPTDTIGHSYRLVEGSGANATYRCSGCGDSYTNVSYHIGTTYHSQEEIRQYIASSGASFSNPTRMSSAPVLTPPYAQGSVSESSLEAALAMLNQFRYIAGVDANVSLDTEYNRLAQAAATVNAANDEMSHEPQRPSGMSDALYDAGCLGAGRSNLAYAWNYNLSQFISMWMDDSDLRNIDRIGHRRWVLNPVMRKTGFGSAARADGKTYASMYAFDQSGSSDVQGVVWPAREMPAQYFERDSAWSYSYGQTLSKSDITVEVTCQNAGSTDQWSFSAANTSDGYFNVENSNYGQPGCIIFQPEGIDTSAGMRYLVTIRQSGSRLAEYTVSFF